MSEVNDSIEDDNLDDLDENPCGYTYDHSEYIIYEDDELVQWGCHECGTEVYQDK